MALHIGITLGLYSADESIWTNGIKQNALALTRTLKASAMNHRVTLVNTTQVPITAALPWDLQQFDTQPFEAVEDSLDILILLGGQLQDAPSAKLRARGVKLVGYKCGSEAIMSAESVVHGLPVSAPPYYNRHLNQLWLIPQVAELNSAYYQVLHRCAVAKTVPFVWHPAPLEDACKTFDNQGLFKPTANIAKRLVVPEPNRELLKTFLHPLMIAELFYRTLPECVGVVQLMNLFHRREHAELLGILSATDLYHDQKLTVEGRHNTPWLLAHHTDVIISHQWGNPLNYSYLEAAWLGYPLVHNAALCSKLGFFYEGCDVVGGAEALNKACSLGMMGGSYEVGKTPEMADAYRLRQRYHIQMFLADNPKVVAQYDELLTALLNESPD